MASMLQIPLIDIWCRINLCPMLKAPDEHSWVQEGLQTGHLPPDFSSVSPGGRQSIQFWQEFGTEILFHTLPTCVPTSRSSLSPLQPTTHTHTLQASNKGKSPIKAQLLHLPIHTCQETKTTRESCPGNMSNTPVKMQASWHPRACTAVYTKNWCWSCLRSGRPAHSQDWYPRFSSTPSHPAEKNYPLFDPWRAQAGW